MKGKPLTSGQLRAARAFLRWRAEDLARKSAVGVATVRRAELAENETSMTAANDVAVRRALETAGVEFIDENGGGPGVRLRARPLAMNAVTTLSIAGLSLLHRRLSMPRLERAFVSWRRWRARAITKIERIQIVLAGDADQGEQGVTASVGQGRAHALRIGGLGNGTDRPIRRDPLAGGMRQHWWSN